MDNDTPPKGNDAPATEPASDPVPTQGPTADVGSSPEVASPVPPVPSFAVPPAPPLDQLPPTPPPQKPRSARRFVPIAAAILVIALAGAAIAVINSGGDESASTTTPTPTSESPPPVVNSPQSLTAEVSTDSVTLTWRPMNDTEGLEHRIARDGVALGIVDGDVTRYVDESVDPGTRYRYAVVTWHDDVASDPATIAVRTEVPKISEARLEGVFNVRMNLDSSYGISGVRKHGTAGWRFRPDCTQGPCDVSWKGLNPTLGPMDLVRDRARYDGSGSGKLGITCGGTRTTSSFRVNVKVIKARMIDGEWTAVKIEGTWSFTDPAALGCVAAGATYDVVGAPVT